MVWYYTRRGVTDLTVEPHSLGPTSKSEWPELRALAVVVRITVYDRGYVMLRNRVCLDEGCIDVTGSNLYA